MSKDPWCLKCGMNTFNLDFLPHHDLVGEQCPICQSHAIVDVRRFEPEFIKFVFPIIVWHALTIVFLSNNGMMSYIITKVMLIIFTGFLIYLYRDIKSVYLHDMYLEVFLPLSSQYSDIDTLTPVKFPPETPWFIRKQFCIWQKIHHKYKIEK